MSPSAASRRPMSFTIRQFACELKPIDFAKAAKAMGGRRFSIDNPRQIDWVLDKASAAEEPVVEAVVDPYEPLLPPPA